MTSSTDAHTTMTIPSIHDEKHELQPADNDVERGKHTSPSETATIEAPEPAKVVEHVHSRDFGLIPIPKYLRVSEEKPPKFDIFLNILFGLGSTFSE